MLISKNLKSTTITMASSLNFKIVIAFSICFLASSTMVTSRPLSYKLDLLARLKLDQDGSSSSCWDSLFELQSCTGEVLMFFLNGETYLGPGCCDAIRTIEHHCWSDMLASLGYTTEEGDILRGYCDASESGGSTPEQPSPPQAVVP